MFNAGSVKFGYQSFITSAEFRKSSNGFLVGDTCIIVAEASVNNSGHDNDSPKEMSLAHMVS